MEEVIQALGDPYTMYLTPEEYAAFQASMSDQEVVGIGISAPASSWGTLANEARGLIESNPIQIIWPVGAICLTMLSLNFIGDGVSDAFDPKKK